MSRRCVDKVNSLIEEKTNYRVKAEIPVEKRLSPKLNKHEIIEQGACQKEPFDDDEWQILVK